MLKLVHAAVLSAALFCAAPAGAQQAASIEDAAWLAGRWVGQGLGGQLEETWAPPAGGQMVGHFRLIVDGAPRFYEIMLMDVVEGGVRMRVKHFNPDFVGWEQEPDDWVAFDPVSAGQEALEFEGLSIRRVGPDEVAISLIIEDAGGAHEERISMRRAPM